MAADYTITGQTKSQQREPDCTYKPVVEVSYQTTTDPPIQGSVTVPAHLLKDKVKYVEAVQSAVEAEVASHQAVASL